MHARQVEEHAQRLPGLDAAERVQMGHDARVRIGRERYVHLVAEGLNQRHPEIEPGFGGKPRCSASAKRLGTDAQHYRLADERGELGPGPIRDREFAAAFVEPELAVLLRYLAAEKIHRRATEKPATKRFTGRW